MKFLVENFGESEELNTFVNQVNNRFKTYYIVKLILNGNESNKYFAYKEAAKKYYDDLIKETEKDKDYYDGAEISWSEVNINLDQNELDRNISENENEEIADNLDFFEEE